MILPRLHIVLGVKADRKVDALYLGNSRSAALDAFNGAGKAGFALSQIFNCPHPNRIRRFGKLDSIEAPKPRKVANKAKPEKPAKKDPTKKPAPKKPEPEKPAAPSTPKEPAAPDTDQETGDPGETTPAPKDLL